MLLLTILIIITGALSGMCLHKFYQNGWVPEKYFDSPTSD